MLKNKRTIRSYVLRQGRITKAQQKAWELYSERYLIPSQTKPLIQDKIFSNKNPLIVEIGCGHGDATLFLAEKNPQNNYLAFEVYRPGIGALMHALAHLDLSNVKIAYGDAIELLPIFFTSQKIDGVNIFFPDPWPKKKHQKRRLICKEFLELLAGKLNNGAFVYFASDCEDYTSSVVNLFNENPLFVSTPPPCSLPNSAYKNRAYRAGRKISELCFRLTAIR